MNVQVLNRRAFHQTVLASAAGIGLGATRQVLAAQSDSSFQFNYSLASSLYGKLPLEVVLAEVSKIGAKTIDLWPLVHGDHREQVTEMGEEKFRELLQKHNVQLGMTSRYDLKPDQLREEILFVQRMGGNKIVTMTRATEGETDEARLKNFMKQLEPVARFAADHGVTLAIENHSNSLLKTPESVRHFAELATFPGVGLAFAPYHLPQHSEDLGKLLSDVSQCVVHFYAWQYGFGSSKAQPKSDELLQLPGRGPLDFRPMVRALRAARFTGWTQIFMHPFPRGFPILPTATEVTETINASRRYLDGCLS